MTATNTSCSCYSCCHVRYNDRSDRHTRGQSAAAAEERCPLTGGVHLAIANYSITVLLGRSP
jgi:hypothetical protein